MAGTFVLGEKKVRPGTYFNIQKNVDDTAPSYINGVTAVMFRADFGPLNTVVELDAKDSYENIFGTGLTTDAIREAVSGGAQTIIACRVGSGGTLAEINLEDSGGEAAVAITVNYPGAKEFAITVRDKLSDNSRKECIIYTGTEEFEKAEFTAGAGEATALAEALSDSKNFHVSVMEGKEEAILSNVAQASFSGGTNPVVTTEDYSNAFAEVEPYEFNTICVDTEDVSVHQLLLSFMRRVFDAGLMVQAVVAERHTVDLETRMQHAAAFNDEKMNYVLNAYVNEQGKEIDGYQTAARIAGMIGACTSNSSLTHTVVEGFTEIMEKLTNTQIITAENEGCIVLSNNRSKQVWIDSAINTLIVPAENQDDGWKKIRRVKTRFELMRRVIVAMDELVGSVDNDSNGRSTVIKNMQDVADAMVEEEKLVSCKVTESEGYAAEVDSAWFDIAVVDKDSMEHAYLTFKFQFSSSSEE